MTIRPEELRYLPTHEWAFIEKVGDESIATIGISAFAVEQLNDIVFMVLVDVGTQLEAGGEYGEVESVKAVSPMYAPVSGEVIASNKELINQLETLGSDPYSAGWMIKVRMKDASEAAKLLGFAAYTAQCADHS